jgi:hypothetical protein
VLVKIRFLLGYIRIIFGNKGVIKVTDIEKLREINERWEEGELTWEDLKQDYLWLKDKCNQLINK